jgi:hypothetical protein
MGTSQRDVVPIFPGQSRCYELLEVWSGYKREIFRMGSLWAHHKGILLSRSSRGSPGVINCERSGRVTNVKFFGVFRCKTQQLDTCSRPDPVIQSHFRPFKYYSICTQVLRWSLPYKNCFIGLCVVSFLFPLDANAHCYVHSTVSGCR